MAEEVHDFIYFYISKFFRWFSWLIILILLTEIFVIGHYVSQLSQVIVRYNLALTKKTINLKGYMVGNVLTDDYPGHLGVFQFMWSAGLISDQTYRRLNLLCVFQSFIHTSSSCDKILGVANEELGDIDPYSIFAPTCPGNVSQSNCWLKRINCIFNLSSWNTRGLAFFRLTLFKTSDLNNVILKFSLQLVANSWWQH
ncbi:hypothetical protein I3842_15G147200 [Carya illinoinensis]|uniref:Uncharacterized protein n=1 Tax=Carya illinoinensis TaxID=32201 RepID=A0A922A9B5_CARIL|nr:hypothetical protein I3842_15G147200 [Carya illinoinensis]KAG6676352.1 hypothetical protein I3842_15G147200 [Carya illinoinensis]KAG6676355.1 hypothetical protein I3842_15G147200 [Carya illinoinensis]